MIKTISARDVYQLHAIATDTMVEETGLKHIVGRFTREPRLRCVYLVDSQNRLSGMVTRADLMKWAHRQLFSGGGIRDIAVSESFRIVDTKTARDLVTTDPRTTAPKETDTQFNTKEEL